MAIKVLLGDDHIIMRSGLREMLEKETGIEIVVEVSNGREAVQLARKHNLDVVVMDINMPELNGIEATCQIIHHNPKAKILMLSMYSDQRLVSKAFSAGALGYVTKSCAFDEFVEAIREVNAGRFYLCQQVSATILQSHIEGLRSKMATGDSDLSPREREVLQLLVEGKNTKQVAMVMHISPKTVESHRRRLMDKLGIDNLPDLTKFAIRERVTFLET